MVAWLWWRGCGDSGGGDSGGGDSLYIQASQTKQIHEMYSFKKNKNELLFN